MCQKIKQDKFSLKCKSKTTCHENVSHYLTNCIVCSLVIVTSLRNGELFEKPLQNLP